MGLIKFIGAGQAHQYWILKVENHWSACKSGPFVKLLLPDQAPISWTAQDIGLQVSTSLQQKPTWKS